MIYIYIYTYYRCWFPISGWWSSMMSYLWFCALVMAMAMAPGVFRPVAIVGKAMSFWLPIVVVASSLSVFPWFLGITRVFLHGFCHVFPWAGTRSRGLRTWLGPPWASNSSEHLMASPRWGFHICNGDHGGNSMGIPWGYIYGYKAIL